MLWIMRPAKASTICTVSLPRPEKITRLRLRSSVKWSRRPCTPGSGISCTWRSGADSRSCALAGAANAASAAAKSGDAMAKRLRWDGGDWLMIDGLWLGLSGNRLVDAQLRGATARGGQRDEEFLPF